MPVIFTKKELLSIPTWFATSIVLTIASFTTVSAQNDALMTDSYRRLVESQEFVTVSETADKLPVLTIDYPWFLNKNPSIEIRQLLDNDIESHRIKPLRFKYEVMWEQAKDDIHKMRENVSEIQARDKFDGKIEGEPLSFEMIGQRNSFGKRSVVIVTLQALPDEAAPADDEAPADEAPTDEAAPTDENLAEEKPWVARAIYPFADDWSASRRRLILDLPPQYFKAPMKLRVWFIRGKDTLWSQDVDWPGFQAAGQDE